MNSNKLRGPIIGCALFGVACVSYIAYFFYQKNKKKSMLARLKQLYNPGFDFSPKGEIVPFDNSFDLGDSSEYSDYFVVQATEFSPRIPDKPSDKDNKYDNFEEVAYIEDVASKGKPNKLYKILANPEIFNSSPKSSHNTPASPTSSGLTIRTRKAKKSDDWTVLDNYTNLDGTAEEFTFVETTNNTFSEEVDFQKNESVRIGTVDIKPDSENDYRCQNKANGSNGCCADNGCDPNSHSNSYGKSKLNNGKSTNGFNKVSLDSSEFNNMDRFYNTNESDELLKNPASVKIFMKNFGCSHNISDSEYMLGLLDEYGFTIVDTMDESNIVIINSCTVKGPSEEAMRTFIKAATSQNLPVIVSGCVPQADKNNAVFNAPHISLLGITQIDRIVEVVENSLLGRKMILLEKKELPQLDLPKIRKNKLIEIIPLSTGCLGSCTFCKTKYSRGVLGSYDIEVILDRVESCVNDGVKEIWLTSEDLGAYGIDIGTNIVTLLKSIIEVLPPDVMLRLGMSNPPYIKKHIDDICDILLNDNVYEFIHIPVQSCSNAVLEKMNREYEYEEFLHLVETIRAKVPNCTIATDIIAGFPTETDEDHLITRNALEQLKLPVINISQFYPRKGTVATKMKQLANKIAKNRSRDITNVFMSYETNSKYLNEVFKVYFNQLNDQNQLIGHNKYYIKVMLACQLNSPNTFPSDNISTHLHTDVIIDNAELAKKYLGTVQNVKIVNTTKWHLEGIIV